MLPARCDDGLPLLGATTPQLNALTPPKYFGSYGGRYPVRRYLVEVGFGSINPTKNCRFFQED